jgi:hypothetical protein
MFHLTKKANKAEKLTYLSTIVAFKLCTEFSTPDVSEE